MPKEMVVLVPGFLGFSRFGMFSYFADRVPAAIGSLLQEKWGRFVPVVTCDTVPAGHLNQRVLNLAEFLHRQIRKGVETFYLVGHSTGGVDAQLLLSRLPFAQAPWLDGRAPWTPAQQSMVEGVRERIRAVVTISAPHFGTWLADSVAAKLLEHPLRNALQLPKLARELVFLTRLVGEDSAQLGQLLNHFWDTAPEARRFARSVLWHRELIEDLKPETLAPVRDGLAPEPDFKLTCFVTGAQLRTKDRASNPFWADLNHLCGQPPGRIEPKVQQISDFLSGVSQHDPLWIRSHQSPPLLIDPTTNDGVVNTARQVVHARREELGGIVVADHADVLGHYDRKDVAGHSTNTGLFRSGAGFGDREFSILYDRVTDAFGGA